MAFARRNDAVEARRHGPDRRGRRLVLASCVALGTVLALGVGSASARGKDDDSDSDSDRGRHERVCSTTAGVQYDACKAEVKDDFFTAQAICLQVLDRQESRECFREARDDGRAGKELCRAQRAARRNLCDLVGEGPYDPDFDPEEFETDYENLSNPNPYFPLTIGFVWDYQAADETNRIEVLPKTKLVEGVRCIVLNDRVEKEGGGGEDTDDWYAQRRNGTVDYCGESVQDFEVFEGDEPMEPELIAIDGSFKAGRDGDLAGTIFLAEPRKGKVYRQEWSPGNAEDAAMVLSTRYGYGVDPDLDAFVPRALAELLCSAHDCVVIGEITPVEPELFDLKYYARDIGLFLEVNPAAGEINQLVGCSFDARCGSLPMP